MLGKLSTFAGQVREYGIFHAFRMAVERAAVWILAKRYAFPATWHPPTSVRPYRLAVADAVNALKPGIVCEVGCGLGSILARIQASQRIGYDLDEGVVAAARLIRLGSIDFRVGSLKDVDLQRIGVLILVNWIHEIAPEDLMPAIRRLLPRTSYLLVDSIDAGDPGYRYYHDFSSLLDSAREVSRFRVPGEGRTFIVLETQG